MTTQTFRAATTQDALEQIQREMGPEAIIVSVRQSPAGPAWQVWKQPEVEVVAMAAGGSHPASRRSPVGASPSAGGPPLNRADIEGLLTNLAMQLNQQPQPRASQPAARPPLFAPAPPPPPPAAESPAAALAQMLLQSSPAGESREQAAKRLLARLQATHPQTAPAQPARPQAVAAPADAAPLPAPVRAAQPSARLAEFPVIEKHSPPASSSRRISPVKPAASPQPRQPAVSTFQPEPAALPAALAQARRGLLEHDLDAALVEKALNACAALNPASLSDAGRVRAFLQRQLSAALIIGRSEPVEKALFLVGPSGSGKTSAAAKLAAHFTRQGKRVVWICADTLRAGAIAVARAYTDALGIPLRLAYTPEELASIVLAEAAADLLLIDTAGCNPRSQEALVELGAFLDAIPRRSAWLALPASANQPSLQQCLSAFSLLSLQGLLLTKLDETAVYGPAFNLAWRSQLPLTFFSNGPRTPEDFLPAQAEYFTGLLFTSQPPAHAAGAALPGRSRAHVVCND